MKAPAGYRFVRDPQMQLKATVHELMVVGASIPWDEHALSCVLRVWYGESAFKDMHVYLRIDDAVAMGILEHDTVDGKPVAP